MGTEKQKLSIHAEATIIRARLPAKQTNDCLWSANTCWHVGSIRGVTSSGIQRRVVGLWLTIRPGLHDLISASEFKV
jgi:hypothetical protein